MSKVASTFTNSLSIGGWVICAIAVVSSVTILAWPIPAREGQDLWLFARTHRAVYEPLVEEWNRTNSPKVHVSMFELKALERRVLSAFHSNTPSADLIEVEVTLAARAFGGPVESVGFVDLTQRLRREGLYHQINEPSFGPSTSRGHIFGLPHDVHPVLLAYRADIVEAAKIDLEQAETWDDFIRLLRPLIQDLDGDGAADRYLLGLWETMPQQIEVLMLQGGGRFFDDRGAPVLDTPENARTLSTIVSWISGPDRIAADVPTFSASGNKLLLDGYVVAYLLPDWLGGIWKRDLPQLSGKLKLMPLPAFERGGRRTSVQGGTILGIATDAKDFEAAWRFAKYLYLSQDSAHRLYQLSGVISPVKAFWSDPIYSEPDPYFSGQPAGSLYIEQAANVPMRASSPFNIFAQQKVNEAVIALKKHAVTHQQFEPAQLEPQARVLLAQAQNHVQRRIQKNVFLRQP